MLFCHFLSALSYEGDNENLSSGCEGVVLQTVSFHRSLADPHHPPPHCRCTQLGHLQVGPITLEISCHQFQEIRKSDRRIRQQQNKGHRLVKNIAIVCAKCASTSTNLSTLGSSPPATAIFGSFLEKTLGTSPSPPSKIDKTPPGP